MSTFKPVISSGSRIYDTEGRYPRKRRGNEPKGKKAIGKDIGKLTEIFNVPLDVFFEITSHLNPIDILQLARASKELRAMLLSRSARGIWLAARRNIVPQMLECPAHMNEAQYVSLVFERTCNACGVIQSVNVEYAIPVRLCGPCWKANVKNGGKLARDAGYNKITPAELFNLLPVAHLATRQYKFDRVTVLAQTSRLMYYEPEFAAVVRRYQELSATGDQKALQEFVDGRKADAIRRVNFNLAMAEWEKKAQEEKRKMDVDIQEERVATIKHRLRDLGYSASDIPSHDYQVIQMLNQPRRLTTRIWNTIRPKLVAILDAERQRSADEEFRTKWGKRSGQFEQHYRQFLQQDREDDARKRALPGFKDAIALCQGILTGVESDGNVTPDVTPEEYAAFEARVLAHADNYLARVGRDLATLMRKSAPGKSEEDAPQKPKKPRGRTSNGKAKAKARESDDESDQEPDEAEVLALLNTPTALFSCRDSLIRHKHCSGLKPFLGHVEHWQECHGSHLWSAEHTQYFVGGSQSQRQIAYLLDALRLPPTATMAAVQCVIGEGRWACSCGYNAVDKYSPKPEYLLYHELMKHFNMSEFDPPGIDHIIVKPPPPAPPRPPTPPSPPVFEFTGFDLLYSGGMLGETLLQFERDYANWFAGADS